MKKKILSPPTGKIILLMVLTGSEHATNEREDAPSEQGNDYDDSSPVINKEVNAEQQDTSSMMPEDPSDHKPENQVGLYEEERENSVKAKQPLKKEDKKKIQEKRLGDETDDETTI